MKMQIVLLLVGIAFAPVVADRKLRDLLPMEVAPGRCPRPNTVKNFDPAKLAGTWYDIKRYKNTILKGSCGTATYTWYPKTCSYKVPYVMKEFPTNKLTLTPKDVPNGIFKTTVNGIPTPFDFWLLDTDYENYHIVYTCIELIPFILNSQSINIFSRQPTLDDVHLSTALETLKANKLDITILRHVQQNNDFCGRTTIITELVPYYFSDNILEITYSWRK